MLYKQEKRVTGTGGDVNHLYTYKYKDEDGTYVGTIEYRRRCNHKEIDVFNVNPADDNAVPDELILETRTLLLQLFNDYPTVEWHVHTCWDPFMVIYDAIVSRLDLTRFSVYTALVADTSLKVYRVTNRRLCPVTDSELEVGGC